MSTMSKENVLVEGRCSDNNVLQFWIINTIFRSVKALELNDDLKVETTKGRETENA